MTNLASAIPCCTLIYAPPPAVTLGLEPRALYFGTSLGTLYCDTVLKGDISDTTLSSEEPSAQGRG